MATKPDEKIPKIRNGKEKSLPKNINNDHNVSKNKNKLNILSMDDNLIYLRMV